MIRSAKDLSPDQKTVLESLRPCYCAPLSSLKIGGKSNSSN
jgi:hypothetical protein